MFRTHNDLREDDGMTYTHHELDDFESYAKSRLLGVAADFPEDRGGEELPLFFRSRDLKTVYFRFAPTMRDAALLIDRIPEGHKRTWILSDEQGVARIGVSGSVQAVLALSQWRKQRAPPAEGQSFGTNPNFFRNF